MLSNELERINSKNDYYLIKASFKWMQLSQLRPGLQKFKAKLFNVQFATYFLQFILSCLKHIALSSLELYISFVFWIICQYDLNVPSYKYRQLYKVYKLSSR